MTARQVFEATLIELSKVQAPALKLYEFNYLFNKAINLYINKVYNVYDVNQQTTDDLRVLKSTAYLTPKKWNSDNSALHNSVSQASSYLSAAHRSIQSLHGATYEVAMPIDYLHLLNCVCIYYVAKQKDCWDAGSYIEIPATRLTADSWGQIVTDIYNRPSPMKPYYYIHNQNNQTNNELLPTDPIMGLSSTGLPKGTDMTGTFKVISNGLPVTKTSDGNYYANIQGDWYKIEGIEYKDGVFARTNEASLDYRDNLNDDATGAENVLKSVLDTLGSDGVIQTCGNAIDDEDTLKQLLYNTDGTNITGMFYPDPSETVGWARRSGDDDEGLPTTHPYQIKLDAALTKISEANDCDADPGAYKAAVDEYRIAKALVDGARGGYVLVNQSWIDDSGVASSNFPRTFKFDMNGDGIPDTNVSLVEKPTALRAGNVSNVRMEIRYGKDDSLFQLKEVQVDYVKAPQFIRLTQEQIDLTEDTSQIMEFPDYVNQEIINELVHLVMERVNDPRLSNNLLMTQTIVRPTGQLVQPALTQAQLARG